MSDPEEPLSTGGVWLTRLLILAAIAAVAAYFFLLR